ncbi:MAG TPA: bifunctional alpha,alpha-trehalose-phosphate synthase (UDP-forming)/trehalose-phosphatase [Bacteroidota bacterium]|nr:bifunctional alpha,alpha-trehalose-phosphate synthase (UDP-forming)/trehalose-phosphatase [Bacteroidota bacterium]
MQRIIVVSNRLPFTLAPEEQGWKFSESTGGLATGLSTYLQSLSENGNPDLSYLWVGWPGCSVPETAKDAVRKEALEHYHALPVFLSEESIERFYQGFCNKTIWPLFHYFQSYARYHQQYWEHYRSVNGIFCEELLRILQPDDLLWIHDYHLMLLPGLIREQIPTLSVGFFLHIPFPTYEMFRLLPAEWRKELLRGLLGADLIGFHTYDYLQYFLRCVLRLMGHEHTMGQLLVNGRAVKAGTFPMGIDFRKFYEAACEPETSEAERELRQSVGNTKAILSIDRLDYTKGILNRLEGFETFLELHPRWCGKVTLILVVAPSRIAVDQYELMKKQIEEQVGRINGRFGTLEWVPIRYQYKNISFHPLVALYALSDIAMITPLRDGMNLIAKEYVASCRDSSGVLILSEMAGAAKELAEAIIINPNNKEEIASSIAQALDMPAEEQARRNTIMQKRLQRYDVHRWANEFIGELRAVKHTTASIATKLLSGGTRRKLIEEYARSAHRTLFLDYDGTLVGFKPKPPDARPTDELFGILEALARNLRNQVVLVSGRDRRTLDRWFGSANVSLAAEHGAWLKEFSSDWRLIKPLTNEWKAKIKPLLELYVDRLPGSFVEEKEYSLAWHYRSTDPEQGPMQALELLDDLVEFTANIDIQVLRGNKVVEIRNAGVNKGLAAMQWISDRANDFLLAVGDDWTDEDLFTTLPKTANTIHVGLTPTNARFTVSDHTDVLSLLKDLATTK